MRKRIWSAVVLCGLLAGCASRQEVASAPAEAPLASAGAAQVSGEAPPVEAPPEEDGAPPTPKAPVLPLEVTANPEPKDLINIESARVEGDVLALHVSHGGGCAEHTYTLAWDGTFQQGADGTPVANLVLVHDGHNDRCKAFLRARPRFDLSPIAQRFGARFGKASGAVDLALPDQAPVRYDF